MVSEAPPSFGFLDSAAYWVYAYQHWNITGHLKMPSKRSPHPKWIKSLEKFRFLTSYSGLIYKPFDDVAKWCFNGGKGRERSAADMLQNALKSIENRKRTTEIIYTSLHLSLSSFLPLTFAVVLSLFILTEFVGSLCLSRTNTHISCLYTYIYIYIVIMLLGFKN